MVFIIELHLCADCDVRIDVNRPAIAIEGQSCRQEARHFLVHK